MIAARPVQDEWQQQRERSQELAQELSGLVAFGLWDINEEGQKVFIPVLGPPKPVTSLGQSRWALNQQFRWHPVTGESWPRRGIAVQLDPEQMLRYRILMPGGLRLTHHPTFQPIAVQVFVDGRAIELEAVPPTPSRPSAAPYQRFAAVQAARLAAAVIRAEPRAPVPEAVHRAVSVHSRQDAATSKRGVIVADDIWLAVHRYASAHSLAVKDVIDMALRGFLLKPTTDR